MDRTPQRVVPTIAAWTVRSPVALWAGFLTVLIALMLAWIFLPVTAWTEIFTAWIHQYGLVGVVTFAVVYIVSVTALAPVWMLSLAAGMAYGAWGFPLVVISATIGATSAFLISRFLLRKTVKNFAQRRSTLAAIDKAVKDEGWKVVALLRLTPLVPFNLQNYLLGATEIGLLPYVAATFMGIMPGSAMYIYLGSRGHAAATGNLDGAPSIPLLAAGFAAIALVVILIGRRAKNKLDDIGVLNHEPRRR